jgi:sulfate/thiosulfate transport system ATP-binding protein
MSITMKGVTKRFGKFLALDNVSLEVPSGCLLGLLGPSGSGKTTLLRIISGLESADNGSVLYADEDVTRHSARDRNVGFVFQHYALFRHMSVFENIAFGLRVRKRPESEVKERVRELLHLIRLEGLEKRLPSQLSGGQRQRVALARALAARPRVLLLDEPFGALDAKVRQELRQWLRRVHDEIHMTSVFVTHDQEEAFEVADKVAVMNQGRVEQTGTPQEVFDHPANPFVMDFLGHVNVFQGRIQNGQAHLAGMAVDYPERSHEVARGAKVYVRPHELSVERVPTADSVRATVLHASPAGSVARVRLLADDFGAVLQADLPPDRFSQLALKPGDVVYVSPRGMRVFAPAEDYAI